MLRRFALDITLDCDDEDWCIVCHEVEEMMAGLLADYVVTHLSARFVHVTEEEPNEE